MCGICTHLFDTDGMHIDHVLCEFGGVGEHARADLAAQPAVSLAMPGQVLPVTELLRTLTTVVGGQPRVPVLMVLKV